LSEAPNIATEVSIFADSEGSDPLAFELAQKLRANAEPVRCEVIFSGSHKKRYDRARKSGAWRGLSVEQSQDGSIGILRLRDLNVENAANVRDRLHFILDQHFELDVTQIESAHSWVLKSRK
jgi:histidyl-tRNA synthetase